jgi:LacI family transcriptional regulator, galactose operon repressor
VREIAAELLLRRIAKPVSLLQKVMLQPPIDRPAVLWNSRLDRNNIFAVLIPYFMDESQKSRITLLDVAADADVSRSTVSLVIRNVPSISETTRKRVLRSIKKLGYVYHRGAASLRRQHSHAIGLIVSDITNPFFAEIIVAIEERLAEAGFVTLLGNTSEKQSKEERLLRTMQEFPADGILICPTLVGEPLKRTPNLGEVFPVVAIARQVPGLDYVGNDNAQGASLAIEHLFRIGHRRIAFLGADPNLAVVVDDRLKGYQQAFSQLQLKFDPLLVLSTDLNRRGGFDGVQKLMKAKNPPSAVLCFNDVVALGAMEGLQRLGLKPGVDIGIVGFNNIPDAAQCVPGLTTIDNSPRQLGESAAELLLKRIEQRVAPIRTLVLQPQLVVRESCGANPREAKHTGY